MEKNASLHKDLEEWVYIDIPTNFNKGAGPYRLCKIRNALYGLKQSLRAWFEKLARVMINQNFKHAQVDHTLFIKHSGTTKVTTLIIYVDDIIVKETDENKQWTLK